VSGCACRQVIFYHSHQSAAPLAVVRFGTIPTKSATDVTTPEALTQSRLSASRRQAALVVVILNLLLAVALILMSRQSLREAELKAENRTANIARLVMEKTAEVVSASESVMQVLASEMRVLDSTPVTTKSGPQIEASFLRHLGAFPQLANLGYADADGQVLFSGRGSAGANIADRDYFKFYGQHPDADVAPPAVLKLRDGNDTPSLLLTRRIRGANGESRGILLAPLHLDFLEQMIGEMHIGQQGIISLYSAELILLARFPALPELSGKPLPERANILALLGERRQGNFQLESPADGIFRSFAFARTPRHSLTVFVGLSQDDYLAEWRHDRVQHLATWLLFLCLSTIIARQWLRSERVKAALRESEIYNRKLFQDSHIPIVVLDPESGRFVDCNPAAVAIYGVADVDAVRGHDVSSVSAPQQADGSDSASAARQHIARALSEGSHTFHWRHRRPNGDIWDAEVHLMTFQHEGRTLCQFALRDVTASLRLALALQESEARYRQLFNANVDALMLVDNATFIDCNPAAQRLFGCPDIEIFRQQTPVSLSPPRQPDGEDSAEAARRHIEQTLQHGSAAFTWMHRRLDDGREFPAEVTLMPVDIGQRRVIQATVRDITERCQAEATIRAGEEALRQRLEETMRLNRQIEATQSQLVHSEKMASLGQLAAGVAHEINNPIGFVQSNLGSLRTYLADLVDVLAAYDAATTPLAGQIAAIAAARALQAERDIDWVREDIGQLLAESQDGLNRVRAIVQNLRDFSRPGERDWQLTRVNDCLEATLNIIALDLRKGYRLHKDYAELPPIMCMPAQLNQVFMNVLLNAVDAIKHDPEQPGEITIATRRVDDGHIQISIGDNGGGIPPEHLQRIFDPFFTTKPVGSGTGLGLSVAWGIISQHGGEISASSAAGQGTRIEITLPIQPPQATPLTKAS
jgi:PAS domain S-box-containing protein